MVCNEIARTREKTVRFFCSQKRGLQQHMAILERFLAGGHRFDDPQRVRNEFFPATEPGVQGDV
jgi:hypothetical protein